MRFPALSRFATRLPSLRLAAAVMTMASGWVLVLAGYVAYSASVAAGVVITLPSGPLILPGGVIAATLLSGAVMFAARGWTPALALTTLGGLLITIAFVLDRRRAWL